MGIVLYTGQQVSAVTHLEVNTSSSLLLLLAVGQQAGYKTLVFVFSGSDQRRRAREIIPSFPLGSRGRERKADIDQKITHQPPKPRRGTW